jgi:hypothetical protein
MSVRNPSKPTALERAVDQANLEKSARGDRGPNGEWYFHVAANKRDGSQEVHTWVNESKGLTEYRYENGNMIKVDENWDMTPEEIKRRDYHRAYYQKKKAQKKAQECPNLIGAGVDLGMKGLVSIANGLYRLFK